MSARPPKLGRILVFAAATMWSTSGFFSKSPLFDSWPEAHRGVQLVFWRAVFATLVLATMSRKLTFHWKMIPMVLAFAAMNYTFLTAMVQAEAAAVIWLQMTAPVWVFLGSFLLFREQILASDWLMLLFAMFGVGTILCWGIRNESLQVMALGLASGLTYGIVVLTLRSLREHDSAWLITLNHGVTAALFLPYVIQVGSVPTLEQLGFTAAFGVFQMGLPYVLFARGVRSIGSHEASGIGLIEPILVPLWVFLAWRNAPGYRPPDIGTLVGGTLILAGLAIRYGPPLLRKSEKQAAQDG